MRIHTVGRFDAVFAVAGDHLRRLIGTGMSIFLLLCLHLHILMALAKLSDCLLINSGDSSVLRGVD